MRDSASKLDQKQEDAIVALLTHRNIEEAARAIEVAPSTLFRWLKDPEFDQAYREARRMAFRQSIGRLQQGATAAATTLLKMMVDPNVPPSCRIRAADSVLGHAAKAIELEEIEARLAALEEAAQKPDSRR